MEKPLWLCGCLLMLIVACSGSSSHTGAGGGSAGNHSSGGSNGGTTDGGGGGVTGGSGGSVRKDAGVDAIADAGLDGVASCATLEKIYGDAIPAAQQCNGRVTNQCRQTAAPSIGLCVLGCPIPVQDDTTLNAIKTAWLQAGCDKRQPPFPCPQVGIVCLPNSAICVPAADDGPGKCGASR